MKKKSAYEGLQDSIKKLKTPKIDTFKNIYTERNYRITIETPEFTCICPRTGLPDFATITIKYIPEELCVELKSFKEYIVSFRELGIFHENAVNKILEDLAKAVKPRWLRVEGVFNTRGGLQTTVSAKYKKNKKH